MDSLQSNISVIAIGEPKLLEEDRMTHVSSSFFKPNLLWLKCEQSNLHPTAPTYWTQWLHDILTIGNPDKKQLEFQEYTEQVAQVNENYQLVFTVVMKNWEPLVSCPEFAMDKYPDKHSRVNR